MNKYDKLEKSINDWKKTIDKIPPVSFSKLLGILFIAFKLANIINWSWWYILMPVYIPIILVFIALVWIKIAEKRLEELKKQNESN